MCEPTFEEWFLNFAGELSRLNGMTIDFDTAYDRYLPAFENGTCGGTCARHVVVRIPMKPATDSNIKPASHSDFIPAGVPI